MSRLAPAITVLALAASVAHAEVLPQFHLRSNVQRAEYVVVVTEGEKFDGELVVLESWHGGLERGSRLRIPELGAFAKRERYGRGDEAKPLSCARVILFLRRSEDGDAWEPACRHHRCSALWVEGGRLYAWRQRTNPGPCRLLEYRYGRGLASESRISEIVRRYHAARERLARALEIEDAGKRALALDPLCGPWADWDVGERAIEALEACVAPAVPVLLRMLRDLERWRTHTKAVRALGRLGRSNARVAPALLELARAELEFWCEEAPKLEKHWWAGSHADRNVRYWKLAAILGVLADLGHREAVPVARAVRELCAEYPRFAGEPGMGAMVDDVAVCIWRLTR